MAGQAHPEALMRDAESKLRGPLPWGCTPVIFAGATLSLVSLPERGGAACTAL